VESKKRDFLLYLGKPLTPMTQNIVLEKSCQFALNIISFGYEFQKINKEYILSKQVIRSGTSLGANIQEAQGAISKPDFINKMHISLKESNETLYWLKLISMSDFKVKTMQLDVLISECVEINHILTAILIKSKSQR
jgi:four helix bundle protein